MKNHSALIEILISQNNIDRVIHTFIVGIPEERKETIFDYAVRCHKQGGLINLGDNNLNLTSNIEYSLIKINWLTDKEVDNLTDYLTPFVCES